MPNRKLTTKKSLLYREPLLEASMLDPNDKAKIANEYHKSVSELLDAFHTLLFRAHSAALGDVLHVQRGINALNHARNELCSICLIDLEMTQAMEHCEF